MPTLDWIGKRAVVHHHREVPFHLLKEVPELSAGDPNAGNLLVQGDNLLALKALLPYYAGKVKCIYIDPPYNTGNENWVYNDAVNSPEMRDWLGKVVGAEAEDLTRHDKWLCMMYPRLCLLREFLTEDGAIFVSIDDNEVQALRALLDEVFGRRNFIDTIIWQKNFSPKNSARHFSSDHDYLMVYARRADAWRPNLLRRAPSHDSRYANPDNDPRGPWTSGDLSARNFYSLGTYPVISPSGRVIEGPPRGRYWAVAREEFQRLVDENRVWWGRSQNNIPRLKRFLSEVKDGVVPQTLWLHKDVGHTQEAKKELVSIVEFASSDDVFITPKPVRLLRRIIEIGADEDSIVMDSFAGSGTTGHAVLAMNAEDGGHRKFVMVEMDRKIATDVAGQRLRKVIEGYTPLTGQSPAPVAGLGGGVRYCTLGEPLFDEAGQIRSDVSANELAAHVYLAETGSALPSAPEQLPLIGEHAGEAIYLLYNGVLGDRSPQSGNILTPSILEGLPPFDGPKVIYGEGCRLGAGRLARERITFKQIPYQIKVR